MREDMINFHKGNYFKENQEALQQVRAFEDAVSNKNWAEAIKRFPKYQKHLRKAEASYYNPFLTPEEREIIESAYRVPKHPAIEESKRLNEKVAENTRFRAQISRNHGNVTGKELDAEIDKMPDEELLEVLSVGKSYGQDYRKYIEENPKKKKQMIANVKKALKTVGVSTGTAEVLPDMVITPDD